MHHNWKEINDIFLQNNQKKMLGDELLTKKSPFT